MTTTNPVAIAIVLSFLTASSEAATQPKTTDYCLVDAVQATAGGGKTFPLGNFIMKARLSLSGSHYVLDAWNVMPDNPQILEFTADGTYQRSGPTHIRFIDGFDNRGRGTFTATSSEMQIDIDRVKTAPGGENIGRNYGSYKLSSRDCKWTAAG
jgi:hypothetical protein